MSYRFGHLVLSGSPASWEALGFDVHRDSDGVAWWHTANGSLRWPNSRSDASAAGTSGLEWVFHRPPSPDSPPSEWTSVDGPAAMSVVDIDGIATTVASGSTHVRADGDPFPRLDHIVVMTDSLERTSAAVEAVTGHECRRIRETSTVRQGFHRVGPGGVIIEIVERADVAAAHLWGFVVTVPDLDAVVAGAGGLIGAPRDAVQPGRRIATVRSAAGLATAVAVMSPDPD